MTPSTIQTEVIEHPAITHMHGPRWAKEAGYWLSFLAIPLALLLLWKLFRGRRRSGRIAAGVLLVPLTLGIYARFVEPHVLMTARHAVTMCGQGLPGTLRAAVVSDTHYGLFGNAVPMARIASRLSALDVDFVLMPGDFTYYPDPEDLPAIVEPLGALGVPVYASLGNHDVGYPGPDLTAPLTAALEAANVTVLNPGTAVFGARGKYVRVAGLVDLYQAEEEDRPLGIPEPSPLPTIYLQHNPDLIREGPPTGEELGRFDLMVAGHTHGGQVFIPGVTCTLTFACDTLRYGYADNPAGKLFVTSGTGMVALPIRLGVPPVIDVLEITIDRCRPPEQRRTVGTIGL